MMWAGAGSSLGSVLVKVTLRTQCREGVAVQTAYGLVQCAADHGRTVAGGRLRLLTPWLWALAGGGNGYQGRGGERRWAIAAASSRFGAPSLRRMCETCTPAVLTLITRVAAISRLVQPGRGGSGPPPLGCLDGPASRRSGGAGTELGGAVTPAPHRPEPTPMLTAAHPRTRSGEVDMGRN
jgi:hypothetical protein